MNELPEVMLEENLEILIAKEDDKLNEGSNGLALLDEKNALQILTRENAMAPYLAHVRRKIDEFQSNVSCDASTKEGRKEIKKFARGIVKIKTYWIHLGKHAAVELKREPVKLE